MASRWSILAGGDRGENADEDGTGSDVGSHGWPEEATEGRGLAQRRYDLFGGFADVGGIAVTQGPLVPGVSPTSFGVGRQVAHGIVAVFGAVEDHGSTTEGEHQDQGVSV